MISFSLREIADGGLTQRSVKTCPGTTSKRSPRMNFSFAFSTRRAYSPGSWSPLPGSMIGSLIGHIVAAARQGFGGRVANREVVTLVPGFGRMVIDHQNFIRQEHHHVALIFRTIQLEMDRVELETEIVAKGPVESETGIEHRF